MDGKVLVEIHVQPFDGAAWKRLAIRFFKSPIPLFLSLIALVVLSILVLHYHSVQLFWIAAHDETRPRYQTGFDVRFGQEIHKVTWLPAFFHYGPHHQLAIAAASVCITASVVVAALYIYFRRRKRPLKPFTRYLSLAFIFVPAITLTTTAVLYNFIQAAKAGRVDGYNLYLQTTPQFYTPYRGAWMDLEAWTCSVQSWVALWGGWGPPSPGMGNAWRDIRDMCTQAKKGRWILLPLLGLLVLAALTGWVAFKALGEEVEYKRVDEQEEGENRLEAEAGENEQGFEEGRVRLG